MSHNFDAKEIHERLTTLSRNAGKRSQARKVWRPILLPLAIAAAVPAFMVAAYHVDTRLFPVIDGTPAIVVETAGANETRVWMALNKVRGCEFLSLNFYLKGHFTTTINRLDEQPGSTRPVGRHLTNVFVLQVSTQDLLERGQVVVEHRCHPLWRHTKRLFG